MGLVDAMLNRTCHPRESGDPVGSSVEIPHQVRDDMGV